MRQTSAAQPCSILSLDTETAVTPLIAWTGSAVTGKGSVVKENENVVVIETESVGSAVIGKGSAVNENGNVGIDTKGVGHVNPVLSQVQEVIEPRKGERTKKQKIDTGVWFRLFLACKKVSVLM